MWHSSAHLTIGILQTSLQNSITVSSLDFDHRLNDNPLGLPERLPSANPRLGQASPDTLASFSRAEEQRIPRKSLNEPAFGTAETSENSTALLVSPHYDHSEPGLDEVELRGLNNEIEHDLPAKETYRDMHSLSRRVRRFASDNLHARIGIEKAPNQRPANNLSRPANPMWGNE
jgi:hypothetical protein